MAKTTKKKSNKPIRSFNEVMVALKAQGYVVDGVGSCYRIPCPACEDSRCLRLWDRTQIDGDKVLIWKCQKIDKSVSEEEFASFDFTVTKETDGR